MEMKMGIKMQVPSLESLAEVSWHISKIIRALNDPGLLSRWGEPRKYPVVALLLFREVQRRALVAWIADQDRTLGLIRKGQGQHVHLRPDWLRDRGYFVAHYFDTDKPYALEEREETIPPIANRRSFPTYIEDPPDDLREWVQDHRIEVDGIQGVRTKGAEEIGVFWSLCPEWAYGWDCVVKYGNKCGARDHDFRYCRIKRVGLARLYDQLMARYDREATAKREIAAEQKDLLQVELAKERDYSKLRTEVLESKYPADQLLSLYMVQRSQAGDFQAAYRIVMAYAPVWKGVARDFYYKYSSEVGGAHGLDDIVNSSYDICVSALMGHSLETVEVARGIEAPFGALDIGTLLNPRKLKERLQLNERKGPELTEKAVFIYLLNRTLGNDPGNAELLFTQGTTSLPLDSPGLLDLLVDYCAWVLFHESLPGVVTAADPEVNANRFDPGRAGWNLASFFRVVVDQRLRDIYQKEYTRQVEGERVPIVAASLDEEREDEQGDTYTLGEMVPGSSNVEEEVETRVVTEARTKALREVRGQLSARDRELWDKLVEAWEENPKANFSQIASALGRDPKTLRRFLKRVRPLAEKAGLRELV